MLKTSIKFFLNISIPVWVTLIESEGHKGVGNLQIVFLNHSCPTRFKCCMVDAFTGSQIMLSVAYLWLVFKEHN